MTGYKKGMQFTCPHCGGESVIKIKTEMDGWTKLGECFACTLCDAKVGDIDADTGGSETDQQTSEGADKLLDFLGTDASETEEVIEDDGARQFCRDCTHLLDHPFKVYCLLHKKDVNPMDDCDKFERKK